MPNIIPDNMLLLVTCLVVLATCIIFFVIVFNIAFKIKNNKVKIATMAASILYILSPIDAFPDVMPIFGQIDDACALATFIGLAFSSWKKQKREVNNDVK